MIRSPREALFGVGRPQGEEPGALSSSAKSEDFDPGAGLGSSSKRERRDLEAAAEGTESSSPNNDMAPLTKV